MPKAKKAPSRTRRLVKTIPTIVKKTRSLSPLAATAKALKVSTRKLHVRDVKELTSAKRAVLLGIKPQFVKVGTHLSPSFPREGENALDYQSPVMVLCGQVGWSGSNNPTTGLALFSSKFWNISRPSVQVEFKPDEPGKKYLVELYLTCLQKSETYKFRVLPTPGGTTKDVSFPGNTKVLPEVVQTHANFSGTYSVTFMQLDPKSALKSWYFHKAVVVKAG